MESLAMIEEVGIGGRDVSRPILWFSVFGDGWGALQIFEIDDPVATALLCEVHDAHDLNGRLCVVEKEREYGGTVKFLRLLRKPRR